MSTGSDFCDLVAGPETGYEDVRAFLQAMTPAQRREAIEAVGGKRRHKRLFDLAATGPVFGPERLVPHDCGPLEPVICYGKNSLPSFSIFQKRMCRPSQAGNAGDRLLGYNHQALRWLTGPGYFVVRESTKTERELGPVAIDYNLLPSEKPDPWPTVRCNARGVSRFVYGHTIDYLRALCEDVFVGRATRRGRATDNFFLLAREAL